MASTRKRGIRSTLRSSDTKLGTPVQISTEDNHHVYVGVLCCFFLSGFAALIYQIAWLRELSIAFGTSEVAVATVLAAYMGGLAVGSAIAGRGIRLFSRPVFAYGLLEAGIAVSALAVPLLISVASWLLISVAGDQPRPPSASYAWQPLTYFLIAVGVLGVPTILMGATLPMLLRYAVRDNRHLGQRTAVIYATNTLGAVLGVLVAGFWLLPLLGLNHTVFIGVAANIIVFGIAALIARKEPNPLISPINDLPKKTISPYSKWILPLMALSGAVSFTYEVMWTRLLNHVLGGTVYAFSTMLASFLLGIAVGSMLAAKFTSNRAIALRALALTQMAIAFSAACVYAWIQNWTPSSAGLSANALVAGLVMLASTVFIGATFPLSVRVLANDQADAASSAAQVYAWNTVGAIAGAMAAGFILIPLLHFEGVTKLAVLTNLSLAFVVAIVIERPSRYGTLLTLAIVFSLIATFFLYKPTRAAGVLEVSVVDDTTGGTELFYSVGRSATVLLKERDGAFQLRTNGLPEATILPIGAPPSPHSQRWLTALPLFARPDARDMLVIGLGGGVAVERIPAFVDAVTVIELEPEVITANRRLSKLRAEDPLVDPRITIVSNDARGALRLTSAQYDIVVSQPSHPWTAGASHLYTREFVSLVSQRLRPNGVFVQWINSQFIDAGLLKSLAATLLDEFQYVELYQPQPEELLFVASEEPIKIFDNFRKTGSALDSLRENAKQELGVACIEDLLVFLALDASGVRGLASGSTAVTDDSNRMAFFSRPDATGIDYKELVNILAPFDPLLLRERAVTGHTQIDNRYLGRRMIESGFESRALRWITSIEKLAEQLVVRGAGLEHHGRLEEAVDMYRRAEQLSPNDPYYQYLVIRGRLGLIAAGTADKDDMLLASRLSGVPAAVIAGWQAAQAGQWVSVARLDPIMAQAKVTDPWFADAVKLRADWRARTVAGTQTEQMLREGQKILDGQLLIAPSLDLLVIRAAIAVRQGDLALLVETSASVARQVHRKIASADDGVYLISEVERQALLQRLNALHRQIIRLSAQFADPSPRVVAVRTQLEDLQRSLAQL